MSLTCASLNYPSPLLSGLFMNVRSSIKIFTDLWCILSARSLSSLWLFNLWVLISFISRLFRWWKINDSIRILRPLRKHSNISLLICKLFYIILCIITTVIFVILIAVLIKMSIIFVLNILLLLLLLFIITIITIKELRITTILFSLCEVIAVFVILV